MNTSAIAIAAILLAGLMPHFSADALADIQVKADNDETVKRVRGMLAQVEQHSPFMLRNISTLTLVKTLDATTLAQPSDQTTVREVPGSFAAKCLVSKSKQPATGGPYDSLPAAKYMTLCRCQILDEVGAGTICRFEVHANGGKIIGGIFVTDSKIDKGQWSVIPCTLHFKGDASGVEYHFWPNGHTIAVDQIFVLQIDGAPKSAVVPADVSSKEGAATEPAIDIPVPSAAISTTPIAAPPSNPSDPDEIERPEYQNAPKPLYKSVTSITSMMVNISDDGEAHGVTSDIIAVVPPESRHSAKAGIGFARVDGDDEMKTALQEAVRAVTLRYPIWGPGHIDLSFGEKFISHGGPSAGTAFGVLMLSVLEGFTIDPKCAVTGDITVDWKVRKVGGVSAKLHGATLDKCLYAVIPEDNETAFADMGCLYGHSALWAVQVFSVERMQDAVSIARKDRSPELAQAINLFADLQPQLNRNEVMALRNPKVIDALHKILELAPNHLSAKYVLALSDGTFSPKLSENGTLHQLSVIFYPYRTILDNSQKLDRATLPAYVTALAKKRLNTLKPIANKDLLPLVNNIDALISSMDQFAEGETSADEVLSRAQAVDAGFAALDSGPDFAERLVREGY